MSAYVVDPRTIDYLVAWAQRKQRDGLRARVRTADTAIPEEIQHAVKVYGDWTVIHLDQLTPTDMGRILMAENVRSVRSRYPHESADNIPGPCDQRRVWSYTFQPVPLDSLRASWVVRSCDCLDYQSCETDDWRETLAHAIVEAIRESAITVLVGDDAPWGVSDEDLSGKRVAV